MSNYTQITFPDQLFGPTFVPPKIELKPGEIKLNTGMPEFIQIADAIETHREFNRNKKDQDVAKPKIIRFPVRVINQEQPLYCPQCGSFLKKDGTTCCDVIHIPYGNTRTELSIERQRYECTNPKCRESFSEGIPFKVENHKITKTLQVYIEDLLCYGLTLKEVAEITHVSKNIVKDIDKERLLRKYTVNGEGKELKPPEEYTRYVGVDEFLLHKGNVYATVFLDIESGHVLYLAHGKKKSVVYNFMDWAGDEWMKHVVAIGCDMNSDFEEAFRKRYPAIKTVYDHFHIIKNFNDKVISEVRKDEYKRLMEEGRAEEAKHLKGAKYILTSKRETLQKHDAAIGTVINPGSTLFNMPAVVKKNELVSWYDELINENKLLFTADLVKGMLDEAYKLTDTKQMSKLMGHIIGICYATNNSHFKWFGNLLKNHIKGIITHAELQLSSGKVEGTNRKIKTIRWQAYGFKDDEYFFLKIIDATRSA